MFIYKGHLPSTSDFHDEGPANAFFTATESGHMDTNANIQYVKHLEPHLGSERPVFIYQGNFTVMRVLKHSKLLAFIR